MFNMQNTMYNFMDLSNMIVPQNNNNQQNNCFEQNLMENIKQQQQPKYQVFLKAAKARVDQYVGGAFPDYLLCNPYKYDLKINGNFSNTENDIVMELLDRETKEFPPSTGTGDKKKDAITVESVEKIGHRELVFRFSLNLCSFHYKKRDFILKVSNVSTGAVLFVSTPFLTYARKRRSNKKKKIEKKAKKEKKDKKRKFENLMKQERIQETDLFFPTVNVLPTQPTQTVKRVKYSNVKIQSPVQQQQQQDDFFAGFGMPTISLPTIPQEEIQFNFGGDNSDSFTGLPGQGIEENNIFNIDFSDSLNLPQQQQQQVEDLSPLDFFTQANSLNTPQQQQMLPTTPINTSQSLSNDEYLQSQKTSLAIQLMSQLSPMERQKVSFIVGCNINPQHI